MCKYVVYSRKPIQSQIAGLSLGWNSLNFLKSSRHSSGETVVHVINVGTRLSRKGMDIRIEQSKCEKMDNLILRIYQV